MRLFESAAAILSSGESLVLAAILERSGSAPRSVGSRMLIRLDGSLVGSIGGGLLEARVVDLAADVFRSQRSLVQPFTLSSEEASRSGMICGGRVEVLIHHVDASNSHQTSLYRTVASLLRARRVGWLVTRLPNGWEDPASCHQSLVQEDVPPIGPLDPHQARMAVARHGGGAPGLILVEGERFFVEPLRRQPCVFIFGAGHVSRELAFLTRFVELETIVLDDREEFANRERFPTADAVRLLPSFDNALDDLAIDEDSFLVLVTRGHAHDETVLRQALGTRAGYIGMIGSRHKRDAIFQRLQEEGFTADDLGRVHCPIGLALGAETPAEIAVSIVAELIRVRRGNTP